MAKRQNQGNKPNSGKVNDQTSNKSKPASNRRRTNETAEGRATDKKAMTWLIWGSAAVSLVFWLGLDDAFNSPKSWVLSISAAWLFGWLIFHTKFQLENRTLKLATILAGAFSIAMFVAWLATDNKYVGLFGEFGRRTGLLTYLSLTVFFLGAAFVIRIDQTSALERAVVLVGTLSGIYGFFQHYKIDFVKWNYVYNSVFGTLGNPDFAAASMAILLVLNFGIAIQVNHRPWFRAIAGFNFILLAIVIVFSQARQGLLAAGLGVGFVSLVWIYQRHKTVSYGLIAISILVGFGVIAGMLKIGPFSRYVYKASITYRGDYWRAGARMFIHHPLFGVGLDRYGANFRQYRDETAALRFGPQFFSNAAHNVPLQLAATGGIFVLIAFLAIIGFIFWRGVVALRSTTGSNQLVVAIIFGAWLSYEAQAFISIDNIGISVWGYLLGGAVVGISLSSEAANIKRRSDSIAQPFVSALLAMALSIMSLMFYGSENSMHYLRSVIPPKDPALLKVYEQIANKPLTYVFKDPALKLASAQLVALAGGTASAIPNLKSLIASDPRNYDAIYALSIIYANQKNWPDSIAMDKKLIAIDPLNQITYLQLGRAEKALGNLAAARAVIPAINAIAPNSAEAKQALAEFGK